MPLPPSAGASASRLVSISPTTLRLDGGRPLKRPVEGSMANAAVPAGIGLPSSPRVLNWAAGAKATLEALATGVVDFVVRADSRLAGPDWNELMSTAVTA